MLHCIKRVQSGRVAADSAGVSRQAMLWECYPCHGHATTPDRQREARIIKLITFLARRPDLTVADFHSQLQHRRVSLPGLRGHILNIPLETHSRADVAQLDVAPFDAIEELWFDTQTDVAFDAAGLTGACRAFITEEQWMVPLPRGPRPGVKSFTAIQRRGDATPDAFQRAWRDVHGPMAATVPLLRGFVLSGILAEHPYGDIPPLRMALPLDGIAESWCDDLDARRAMVTSPEAQHWFADGATFLGQVKTVLLREVVLLDPIKE